MIRTAVRTGSLTNRNAGMYVLPDGNLFSKKRKRRKTAVHEAPADNCRVERTWRPHAALGYMTPEERYSLTMVAKNCQPISGLDREKAACEWGLLVWNYNIRRLAWMMRQKKAPNT